MFRLAWKNIWHKPLSTLLSLLLFSLGIGLISFILLLNHQIQQNFERNLVNIDLVVGAKGSPLQLILCAMYHIDSPTGNIKLSEAKPFLSPNHPLIAQAIPLSLGDSHEGYRIVGTTANFPQLYEAKIAEGRLFQSSLEVTLGAAVAQAKGLKVGDVFKSSHGLINDGMDHTHEQELKVVGIFEPTGNVIDQLIVTSLESIWAIHDTHEHQDEATPHEHQDEHEHEHEHDVAPEQDKEITALLVKYRNRTSFQALNLARNINENTGMLAAVPALEMNRLYALLGVGEQTLRSLALIIMLVSGLSIFISLFNGLKERRYELALMRVMGAFRRKLFSLIISEAVFLSLLGILLGLLLSHVSMFFFAQYLQESFRYSFSAGHIMKEEYYLALAGLLIGILASVIPAIMAYKTDISKTLSDND
jgi:putative ABC transport system permease protein